MTLRRRVFATLRRLYPVEYVALLSLALMLAMTIHPALQLYVPGLASARYLLKNYFVPMMVLYVALATLATLALALRRKERTFTLRGKLAEALRLTGALMLCVYCFFHFKWWSHLLNNRYYDSVYAAVDRWLAPAMNTVRYVYTFGGLDIIDGLYLPFYLLMLPILIGFTALRSREVIHETTAGIGWSFLIGGVLYSAAPALGPFVFDSTGKHTPTLMIDITRTFRESGGRDYLPEHFTMVLGAMPSMHLAQSFLFTGYALRLNVVLGAAYTVVTALLLVQSVMLEWHYLADIVAGGWVAVMAALAARILTARWSRAKGALAAASAFD